MPSAFSFSCSKWSCAKQIPPEFKCKKLKHLQKNLFFQKANTFLYIVKKFQENTLLKNLFLSFH